jgi:carboxypeptidase C (cathepsin A)
MEALGAEVSSYDSCNMDINRNFLFNGDWMQPYHRLVPGILEKIPVLIYAGDADFICNCEFSPAISASRHVLTTLYRARQPCLDQRS